MKTAIDILQAEIDKHPRTGDQLKSKQEVMWVLFEVALNAMESYHAQFSQQPTEKSREDLYQIIQKYLPGIKANELTDTLIQSGYLQIKNPIIAENGLSANTDSVDADVNKLSEESAGGLKGDERYEHIAGFKSGFLAGSKVKPVNEKNREALEKVKDTWEMNNHEDTMYSDIENIMPLIRAALSTDPDDKV